MQNTGFYTIDLSNGIAELQEAVGDMTTLSLIDAIGYNVLDNYVYGLAQTGVLPGSLIRIGAGGLSQTIASGIAPTLFSGQTGLTFLAGDVDETGTFWAVANSLNLAGAIGQFWMTIDVASLTSSTYGTVTGTGVTGIPYPILDWAFVPGGGNFLWALGNAPGSTRLVQFSRQTKTWNEVTNYGNIETNTWGALFATPDGNLYAVDQGSGKLYKFPVTTNGTPQFIATTTLPLTGVTFIDGARCASAE